VASEPIIKEIYIEASPKIVFEFLTDPQKILRWMGVSAHLEPTPGGVFQIDPNGRDLIRGTYLEVVPHSRVVLTWGYVEEGHRVPAGSTVVEIELKPEGKGTRLRLTHRDLEAEARDAHDTGWPHYLERLKTASEGRETGPDQFADPSIRHG
jgi:uncharacterized protein YndB with AHSA1/START domain